MIELTEYQRLYLNLGATLSLWQDVELGLFDVFKKVSKCRDPHIASAIFYSIISFEAKLTMTNAAALFAIKKKKLRAEWLKLMGNVQSSATIRNKLAHFRITLPSGKNPKAKYRVFLTTNAFDTTHFVKAPDESPPTFNYQQVADFGQQFTTLYYRPHRLCRKALAK
jgi:hypothetical protein